METQVADVLKSVPTWLADMIANLGLDAALDLTYDLTKDYTSPDINDMIKGIADASGTDLKRLIRVHMIAGLTQGCWKELSD